MNKYSGTANFKERNNGILFLVIAGCKLRTIGRYYNISGSRVHQIVTKTIKKISNSDYETLKTSSGLVSLPKARKKYSIRMETSDDIREAK